MDPFTLNTHYVWGFSGRGFYTDGTGTTELPQPTSPSPNNSPKGINAAGLVAGFATYDTSRHAYAWANGTQTDLGVLAGMTSSEMGAGTVADLFVTRPINDSGYIVGFSSGSTNSKAFVSTPASRATSAKMLDLNLLLFNSLKNVGLTSLTNAISVNNAGFILCNGLSTNGGPACGSAHQRGRRISQPFRQPGL